MTKFKKGIIVRVSEAYLTDEVNEKQKTTKIAKVLSEPSDDEELVVIKYQNDFLDYVPQSELEIFTGETKTIVLPFGIEIEIDFDEENRPISGNIISSELKTENDFLEDNLYNASMDGIESMVLAHAMAEIDVTTPNYIEGLETAIDSCANNL